MGRERRILADVRREWDGIRMEYIEKGLAVLIGVIALSLGVRWGWGRRETGTEPVRSADEQAESDV